MAQAARPAWIEDLRVPDTMAEILTRACSKTDLGKIGDKAAILLLASRNTVMKATLSNAGVSELMIEATFELANKAAAVAAAEEEAAAAAAAAAAALVEEGAPAVAVAAAAAVATDGPAAGAASGRLVVDFLKELLHPLLAIIFGPCRSSAAPQHLKSA
ncbi:hypothetical protein TSOC_008371 [Tetrabaena socialis]|uniref:Uncharacterized protein n=1 Tax=Tetrabaena socialis TaxID=47790 RepID=A0A2J7ZYM0_9CHLO|nr:hypothetical protein TSOC_008371 [Tetrabaena socialis]|eukprot:PNH05365.1 hypothetical protein TSOC_008371 [Tetrabaena socialis]